jgi:hypothetical protein
MEVIEEGRGRRGGGHMGLRGREREREEERGKGKGGRMDEV